MPSLARPMSLLRTVFDHRGGGRRRGAAPRVRARAAGRRRVVAAVAAASGPATVHGRRLSSPARAGWVRAGATTGSSDGPEGAGTATRAARGLCAFFCACFEGE